MEQDRDFLHSQLVKLGDMMGDGLHHEPGGGWISREYNKICRILFPDMIPKKDYSKKNEAVRKWCNSHQCSQCKGVLKQTRSGSLRVVCQDCGAKFQLSKK